MVTGDGSQSDNEESGCGRDRGGRGDVCSDPEDSGGNPQQAEEKEKTDQSQQTTPTTPPADSGNLIHVVPTFLHYTYLFTANSQLHYQEF